MKFCTQCGKELNDQAVVCVNCGCAVENKAAAPAANAPAKKYNGLAIAGFVVSLVSWFLAFYGVVAIIGVVLSALGMKQCNTGATKGKGLAVAGLVLGIISLVYTLIALLFLNALIGSLNSLF